MHRCRRTPQVAPARCRQWRRQSGACLPSQSVPARQNRPAHPARLAHRRSPPRQNICRHPSPRGGPAHHFVRALGWRHAAGFHRAVQPQARPSCAVPRWRWQPPHRAFRWWPAQPLRSPRRLRHRICRSEFGCLAGSRRRYRTDRSAWRGLSRLWFPSSYLCCCPRV